MQVLMADIAQKDAKVNLKLAGAQRRLAHASTRDSKAMKGLSLLGATFLPGTFMASIFSMSFFNFQPSPDEYLVSSHIWIYIGLTIPLTALVVFGWWWWERVRQRKLRLEEAKLEESIEETEKNIFPEMGTTQPETDVRYHTEPWRSPFGLSYSM
jgi:hypothetical protein